MKNKKLFIVAGNAILVFSVAAFIAGKYLSRKLSAQSGRSLIAATEIPQWVPEALGLFVSREENSIFMGTGGINTEAGPDVVPVYSFDGPVVEVVVTSKTMIYKDVTTFPGPFTVGDIQQKVAEGSLDEIDETRRLAVWGRKTGDRIIADILLYSDLALASLDGRVPQIKHLFEK